MITIFHETFPEETAGGRDFFEISAEFGTTTDDCPNPYVWVCFEECTDGNAQKCTIGLEKHELIAVGHQFIALAERLK